MLATADVEIGSVISRILRWTAFVCCALVLLSFGMFARDETAGASAHQQTELVAGSSASPAASGPVKPHAQPRRFIDGATKVLTSPFDAIVQSKNDWVKRGLPALFALLAYGLGLGCVARYATVR
jgi:hypothetical protein